MKRKYEVEESKRLKPMFDYNYILNNFSEILKKLLYKVFYLQESCPSSRLVISYDFVRAAIFDDIYALNFCHKCFLKVNKNPSLSWQIYRACDQLVTLKEAILLLSGFGSHLCIECNALLCNEETIKSLGNLGLRNMPN